MEKNKIVITTTYFPYGSPLAFRMQSFSKMFQALGYEVIVLCEKIVKKTSEDVEYELEFDGARVYGNYPVMNGKKRALLPFTYSKMLRKIIKDEKPVFIFSGSDYFKFPCILRVVKKVQIPLILESCEWYDPSTFKRGKRDHNYLMHCFCWRFLYPQVNGVVAISRLLEKHYKELGIDVIRIPTIADSATTNYSVDKDFSSRGIKLLFAGSLARTKDSIKPFVEALEKYDDYHSINIIICGVDEQEVKQHLGFELYAKYSSQLSVLGRVPQYKINELYQSVDFGIFFRPQQRSSHAGFSTKLGEGMAAGTPFIVNETGDIGLYIKNGHNGFIVKSVDEIVAVYKEYSHLDENEKKALRSNARETAEKDFSFEKYQGEMENLIDKVVNRK